MSEEWLVAFTTCVCHYGTYNNDLMHTFWPPLPGALRREVSKRCVRVESSLKFWWKNRMMGALVTQGKRRLARCRYAIYIIIVLRYWFRTHEVKKRQIFPAPSSRIFRFFFFAWIPCLGGFDPLSPKIIVPHRKNFVTRNLDYLFTLFLL